MKISSIFRVVQREFLPWTKIAEKNSYNLKGCKTKAIIGRQPLHFATDFKVKTYSLTFGAFLLWTSILNYGKNINSVFALSFNKGKVNEAEKNEGIALLITKFDQLYDEMRFQELYDLLTENNDGSNDEVLWRLARVSYRLSKSADAKEKKIEFLTHAKDNVNRALEINETNFASHKVTF